MTKPASLFHRILEGMGLSALIPQSVKVVRPTAAGQTFQSIDWRLVIQRPNGDPQTYDMRVEEYRIGRHEESNLRLYAENISRRHAVIAGYDDNTVKLSDDGSHNGVKLNGERIDASKSVQLSENDRIEFPDGTTITIESLVAEHEAKRVEEYFAERTAAFIANFKVRTWALSRSAILIDLLCRLQIKDPNACTCDEVLHLSESSPGAIEIPMELMFAHHDHAAYNRKVWNTLASVPGLIKGLRQILQRRLKDPQFEHKEIAEPLLANFLQPSAERAAWIKKSK